jgi:membrane-bound metal-dependent hydrolase YbcI (DUF457 family)
MPSPVGHTLAALAVAWSGERLHNRSMPKRTRWWLALACVGLAVVPDVDLLYFPFHRTATHSLTAAAAVTILIAGLTRWVAGRWNWRVPLVCGAAYLSHLVLDLVTRDTKTPPGVQALWPFSDRWFIADRPIFRGTELIEPFSMPTLAWNVRAVAEEVAFLAPILVLLWLTRPRRGAS